MHLDNIIRFDKVNLLRSQTKVLNDLSFSLSEKRVGIIGHNGSGKSSLVRLINGLLQPNSGNILVHGKNPSAGPQKMSADVGFIFQNPDHQIIFPTVEEELSFGLINQGYSKQQAQEKALGILVEHQRSDWAPKAIHSLSDGQKQLVCILAVLVMEPKVLILDEPFSALDLITRYQLLNLLDTLPQQVVMISHELETLENFDRILWLEGGKIFQDGTPAEVLPEYYASARKFRS
ncbi:energy-coupling factor ABC transporter ATP-binding protein [Nitrincola schmidtii]|uniref:energy-coupling factor ABC transporter ATP-binding protein n=1 Tax=Nitrincola schmidtii TaxID=1730894 RepID=UPI00124EF81B|nr:ABC transporter ATP-binding protein [Nitrincola schmidtii]